MKPTPLKIWIGIAGLIVVVSLVMFVGYTNRLVPVQGLKPPAITLEEHRARRQAFTLYMARFWTTKALLAQCPTAKSATFSNHLAIMDSLLADWHKRYYLYAVQLRYGHMTREKTLKNFEKMTAEDQTRIVKIVAEKLKKEGGCQSVFAKALPLYALMALDPKMLAENVPEAMPVEVKAHRQANDAVTAMITAGMFYNRCPEYGVSKEQIQAMTPTIAALRNTASSQFISALPLDQEWARTHYSQVYTDFLTFHLLRMDAILVKNGCKAADFQPIDAYARPMFLAKK